MRWHDWSVLYNIMTNTYQGKPIKTQLNVYVPVDLVLTLNEEAKSRDTSRSQLVIDILREGLTHQQPAEAQ